MERTESTVVQVAPQFEQEKIQEMETFGWNLQSRQEIHEEGDTVGRPSIFAEFNHTYLVTTKVHHYVKLHFVRSLNLKNYAEIKRIEDECRNQPFPPLPTLKSYLWLSYRGCLFLSLPGPVSIILLGLLLAAIAVGDTSMNSTQRVEKLQAGAIFACVGGAWLGLKLYLRSKKVQIHKASIRGCQELIAKLPPITEATPPVEQTQDTKDCPLCGESIKANAVICRFCNSKLPV